MGLDRRGRPLLLYQHTFKDSLKGHGVAAYAPGVEVMALTIPAGFVECNLIGVVVSIEVGL